MNLYYESDSLQHYGVKGMKWGVRRASKRLSKATTDDEKRKAVASLQKHRGKASAEIAKLQKKQPKLQENVERAITKYDTKAAKYTRKAASARRRMGNMFISNARAERLHWEAEKMESKAYYLKSKSADAKAKVQANTTMQKAFQREIDNIDQILIERGKKYLKGA